MKCPNYRSETYHLPTFRSPWLSMRKAKSSWFLSIAYITSNPKRQSIFVKTSTFRLAGNFLKAKLLFSNKPVLEPIRKHRPDPVVLESHVASVSETDITLFNVSSKSFCWNVFLQNRYTSVLFCLTGDTVGNIWILKTNKIALCMWQHQQNPIFTWCYLYLFHFWNSF